MKIIFLDIDGVLNFDGSPARYNNTSILGIDGDKVKILNTILQSTDANIVLSSSWRDTQEHIDWIANSGIDKWSERYISKTGNNKRRGLEIQDWIDENKFTGKFAVIDDCVFDIVSDIDTANVFQTNENFGITAEDATKVIKHLNENLS